MNISTDLKRFRARRKLSQTAAARALGVPVRTLQDWEQGRRTPGALTASALRSRMGKKR